MAKPIDLDGLIARVRPMLRRAAHKAQDDQLILVAVRHHYDGL